MATEAAPAGAEVMVAAATAAVQVAVMVGAATAVERAAAREVAVTAAAMEVVAMEAVMEGAATEAVTALAAWVPGEEVVTAPADRAAVETAPDYKERAAAVDSAREGLEAGRRR